MKKNGVYVVLPDELMLKLKLHCVKNKMSMQTFVRRLIEEEIKRYDKT